MKKSLRIGLYLIFLCFYSSIVYSYPWPLKPTNQQGYVFSTLDECRENRDHFHDGIDIDCDTGDTVYAVAGGQVIYFTGGDGLYVDRYGYAHTIPFVPNYSNVDAGDSIATVNYRSHLHFMDGPNNSEINPLRPGGISPFSDWADPTIGFPIRFFEDDMGAELDPYDLEGKVDIVIKAWDSITYGGSNAGIYEIGYEIWDGWIRVYGPIFNLTFDNWLESTYIETVYAPGSDTYNFYYIVTNNMTSNNYWDVEATTEADKDYICRILAYDIDQGDQYEDFSIHTAGTGIEDEVSVTVTSPNGGEEWEVGSEHNITWCASAYILGMHLPVEYVLIDYSKDGGWVYPYTINDTIYNTGEDVPWYGSYSWTTPYTPSEYCKVKITTTWGLIGDIDVSDYCFTIFDTTAPAAITDLTASLLKVPPDSGLVLEWSAVTMDVEGNPEQVAHYVIYRDTIHDYEPTSSESLASVPDTTYEYFDSGIVDQTGVNYYYVVKAVDYGANKSATSNMVGEFDKSLSDKGGEPPWPPPK